MWWTFLKRSLRTYNVFPEHEDKDIDEHRLRTQTLSTRIYIIVLIASVLALVLARSLAFKTTRFITLDQPSLQQFNTLHNPQCLCSNIAILYSVFMSLKPQFHSVCFSDFVTNKWIDFLSQKNDSIYYWAYDFRASTSSQFQALASFCNLSQTLIDENLAQFLASQLISIQIISSSVLQIQVEAVVNEFKLNILNLFSRQRYLIQQMIASNQLLSSLEQISLLFMLKMIIPIVLLLQ